MNEEKLIVLGFTNNEAQIYLTLLGLKKETVTKIAHLSKIHRRNVYDVLDRLAKRGLVSFVIKDNRKYYEAVDPQKIVDSFKEKLAFSESILPDLIKIQNKVEKKRSVNVFEGIEGVKTFFNELIKEAFRTNKKIYIIGATGKAFEKMPFFIERIYGELVKKKKLDIYTLANPDSQYKKEIIKKLIKMKRFKFLPHSISPTQIFISGDIVGIMVWSDEPLVTQIIDSEVIKGFYKYYKLMDSISEH